MTLLSETPAMPLHELPSAEVDTSTIVAADQTIEDTTTAAVGPPKVKAVHDLIAGGVAGSASVVVGHPFDTIKVGSWSKTYVF